MREREKWGRKEGVGEGGKKRKGNKVGGREEKRRGSGREGRGSLNWIEP